MKLIEERILQDGEVLDGGVLRVDSFLNHQIDVALLRQFATETKAFFGENVDKILTVEASGIAVGFALAEIYGDIPLVFAKKSKSKTVREDDFAAEVRSFTRGTTATITVAQRYLRPGERVLLVDDFLAEGNAGLGLLRLCELAGAEVVGLATVIEKRFQGGRVKLEEKGVKVFAGASISAFIEGKPVF